MADPITKDKTPTKRSEQNVLVNSFDEDFNILAVELIGYDGAVLRRVAVTSTGLLKVAV